MIKKHIRDNMIIICGFKVCATMEVEASSKLFFVFFYLVFLKQMGWPFTKKHAAAW